MDSIQKNTLRRTHKDGRRDVISELSIANLADGRITAEALHEAVARVCRARKCDVVDMFGVRPQNRQFITIECGDAAEELNDMFKTAKEVVDV